MYLRVEGLYLYVGSTNTPLKICFIMSVLKQNSSVLNQQYSVKGERFVAPHLPSAASSDKFFREIDTVKPCRLFKTGIFQFPATTCFCE